MQILRIGMLFAALVFTTATSSKNRAPANYPAREAQYTPPAPEPMDWGKALGMYRSSFGPVKIEIEPDLGPPNVHGVWVYDREGKEVIGYFSGQLNGNVLELEWQEPADPEPLRGQGFLVFHSDGTGFYGKWWTTDRDRSGDWTGNKFVPGDTADQPTDDEAPVDDYGDGYAEEPETI
jgi:hypothetical protein